MTVDEFKDLFAYDRWATRRLLEAVSPLDRDQYEKNLGSSHGGVRGTLVHTHAGERIWLDRWNGKNPGSLVEEGELPTLELLRGRWETLWAEIDAFLEGLTDESLRQKLTFTDTRGGTHTMRLDEQMQHRINHSTYHRGQVVTLLRQLGVKPPGTDLILYYRRRATGQD